jgi:hypothetical protein
MATKQMTKEQLKKELTELKKRIEIFEETQRELKKENSEIAEILDSDNIVILAIISAKMISIISRFFGIDSQAIKINKQ